MALISVLLSLLIERFLGIPEEFRRYTWFYRMADSARTLAPELWRKPWVAVLLLLLLPFSVVILLSKLFAAVWIVLAFVFGLAVLVYSYGPQDLIPQIEAFIDARLRGDEESARWHLSCVLQEEAQEDSPRLTRLLMETVFVELNERLLGVIFWFVVLGPAGALVYRLSAILKNRFFNDEDGIGEVARFVHYWLSWIPSRLTAYSYGLMGSLVDAAQYRRDEAHKWPDDNSGVLAASGLGALQYAMTVGERPTREREFAILRAALSLVRNTRILWIAVLGVLAIFALIS